MRVFVAFGYRREERWVRELVVPILTSLDISIESGTELPGRAIGPEIRRRIERSTAVIGFLLRRQKLPDGKWTTSDWVRQEIEAGLGLNKDVVQVVEKGVRPPGGQLPNLQRLTYDPRARDAFLVDFTRHIRDWIRGVVFVRLEPHQLTNALNRPGAERDRFCEYQIISDGQVARNARAEVLGLGGGLYVKLTGFSPGSHANLTIAVGGQRWFCRGVPHTQPFVPMQLKR
jgi:hypothetical protein